MRTRHLCLLYLALLTLGCGQPVTNPVPSGENIICFGDSLTYGTGAEESSSYPAQLERLLGTPVINAGIPGDTTARALQRLDDDVLSRAPRIVLITLGGNDFKNGVPLDDAFANLDTIARRIQQRGALVVVGGIELPLFGRELASGYRDLCQGNGAVLVPNIYEGIMGKRGLMSDRIHPNARGYAIMAERFQRAITPYL